MINKVTGNKSPTPIPARILSPALCVTRPTIPGPMLPPRSPAIASKANIAVPPAGNLSDEILIVPGHIIPTEKPQIIHPIKPDIGFNDTEASRYHITHKIPDPIINFIRSILSPYFPKIIRLIPIVTANMQGPVRSPTVFDSPRAASA